jgi:hypothetical protein
VLVLRRTTERPEAVDAGSAGWHRSHCHLGGSFSSFRGFRGLRIDVSSGQSLW